MKRSTCLTALLFLTLGAAHSQSPTTITLTGWFGDEKCAPARLQSAKLGPTNPECSKTCIEKGAALVFISESRREILKVKNYANVVDDLGFKVEVTGLLDESTKTFTVSSVQQLGFDGAACSRPVKKSAK
jgi:hypothetical protein